MSFATFANIVTTLFCLAVLVQSVRMMRSLKAMREGALTDLVGALDKSTAGAKAVLSDLKATLAECGGQARVLAEGKRMGEELSVMIGIADSTAERLLEAAGVANRARAEAGEQQADAAAASEAAAEAAGETTARRPARSRRGSSRKRAESPAAAPAPAAVAAEAA